MACVPKGLIYIFIIKSHTKYNTLKKKVFKKRKLEIKIKILKILKIGHPLKRMANQPKIHHY